MAGLESLTEDEIKKIKDFELKLSPEKTSDEFAEFDAKTESVYTKLYEANKDKRDNAVKEDDEIKKLLNTYMEEFIKVHHGHLEWDLSKLSESEKYETLSNFIDTHYAAGDENGNPIKIASSYKKLKKKAESEERDVNIRDVIEEIKDMKEVHKKGMQNNYMQRAQSLVESLGPGKYNAFVADKTQKKGFTIEKRHEFDAKKTHEMLKLSQSLDKGAEYVTPKAYGLKHAEKGE